MAINEQLTHIYVLEMVEFTFILHNLRLVYREFTGVHRQMALLTIRNSLREK